MSNLIPLHFAHGNGFPSESYQELFDYLAPHFAVHYLPMVGHGEYPVTNNWIYLVDELIDSIKRCHSEPVVGVGHSMGGVLMFMAVCKAPYLFRQLILLDSPIPGIVRSHFLRLMKRLFLIRYLTPIERARTRRINFSTREEAINYFKDKPLFKNFTSRSLELYVQHGLSKTAQGYTLRFARDIETKIFATVPDNLFEYKKPSHLPSALIYSTHSDMIKKPELRAMEDYYDFDLYPFAQGGHLFPFEYPEATAKEITKIVLQHHHL